MPRVNITEGTAQGLERCREFLFTKNPNASKRAGTAIAKQFELLESEPNIGSPLDDLPELRALIITPFGDSGYVVLYRLDTAADTIYL